MPASRSDVLVLFGVTGDLAHKMIFPALYALAKRGALKVPVIGVAFAEVESGASTQSYEGQHKSERAAIDNQHALHEPYVPASVT